MKWYYDVHESVGNRVFFIHVCAGGLVKWYYDVHESVGNRVYSST